VPGVPGASEATVTLALVTGNAARLALGDGTAGVGDIERESK